MQNKNRKLGVLVVLGEKYYEKLYVLLAYGLKIRGKYERSVKSPLPFSEI